MRSRRRRRVRTLPERLGVLGQVALSAGALAFLGWALAAGRGRDLPALAVAGAVLFVVGLGTLAAALVVRAVRAARQRESAHRRRRELALRPEPVVLSWSGGKDSALALAALRADPAVEVVALLTSVTRDGDRVSIHGVRRELVEIQASAAGLPLLELLVESGASNEAYAAAFRRAVEGVRERFPEVRRLAFGDLFLEDVRAYREGLCAAVGMGALFPLWGRESGALAASFVDGGYEAYLVCVDTTQLPAGFAGRRFDRALLAELPPSADPCGERGEFHTFVTAAPVFGRRIAVEPAAVEVRDGRFACCDLRPIEAPVRWRDPRAPVTSEP